MPGEVVPHIFTLARDPDDSHYVNLALAFDAELIVSRDRDLLDLMNPTFQDGLDFHARFPGLRIFTPEELLRRLRSSQA